MSKIAREISKRVSVVALATALAVQAVPVNAVELETISDSAVVEASNEEVVEDKKDVEAKVEEVAPIVGEEESVKESSKDTNEHEKLKYYRDDDDERVYFEDKALEEELINRFKSQSSDKTYVTRGDMRSLLVLNLNFHVTSLEGLQYADKLESLYVGDATGADLTVLNSLKRLTSLTIGKGLVDLSYVSELGLLALGLPEVPNENLDALKNMDLFVLVINNAPNMKDISAIKNMELLSILTIRGTESKKSPLTDISVIKDLKILSELDLSYTNVSDFNTIIEHGTYDYLRLYNCNISDISKLAEVKDYKIKGIGLDGNNISDPTAIFEGNSKIVKAANQTATLPEIVTEAGDVTYKIPYGDYVTDVEIDEKVGKYNPETKEITFYNVTSSKNVTYKVSAISNLDDYNYNYSATITQPIKVTNPIVEPETEVPTVSGNNTQATTTVNKVSEKSPKTGDAGAIGVLSLAVASLAGAVKSRKRK